MSKSFFSSLGKPYAFVSSQSVFISFQLIRQIIGQNKYDSDQRSRKHFLICNLYVKRRMVLFSDFLCDFHVLVCFKQVRFVLMPECEICRKTASYMKKLLPRDNIYLDW